MIVHRTKSSAWWKRLVGETCAAEIAEVALVLPLIFTFLLGIIWFGRAFNIYSTITYAAREGAQAAVVGSASSCATCGSPPTPSAAAAAAATKVQQVLQASHIDPGQAQAYVPNPALLSTSPCGALTLNQGTTSGSGTVNVYSNAQLNAPTSTSNPPACGVVVSFEYPFTFLYLPFTSLNKQQIMLKAVVQMQGEY